MYICTILHYEYSCMYMYAVAPMYMYGVTPMYMYGVTHSYVDPHSEQQRKAAEQKRYYAVAWNQ